MQNISRKEGQRVLVLRVRNDSHVYSYNHDKGLYPLCHRQPILHVSVSQLILRNIGIGWEPSFGGRIRLGRGRRQACTTVNKHRATQSVAVRKINE